MFGAASESNTHVAKDGCGQPGCSPSVGGATLLSGGLAGAYFARTNETAVKFSRVDSTVNFSWPSGTPASALGTDGFSTRWTGSVLPKFSERYNIITRSAGTVRVWVNDALLIDDTTNHAYSTDEGGISMTAGKRYSIRVDYTSDGDSPAINLLWDSSRTAKATIPANRLYAASLDANTPSAPGSLHGSNVTTSTATIKWNLSGGSDVVGYDVYAGGSKVNTVLADQNYYVRSNLTAGTTYGFSVQAVSAAGKTSDTITTSVKTTANSTTSSAPSAPGNLHVGSTTSSTIALSWAASTGSGVTYRIYRGGTKLGVVTAATSYTDTGLNAGTSYTYQVRAVDNNGDLSSYSNSATASTSAAPVAHNAFSTIAATSFDGAAGVSTSGGALTSLDNGDYVMYHAVNFGSSGAKSIQITLGAPASVRGGSIELHLDGPTGTSIGTMVIQPSGAYTTYYTTRMNVGTTTGSRDLYLVFKNQSNMAYVQSLVFSTTHLTQVMALGDSITQSENYGQPWRYYLDQSLRNAGKSSYDFVGSVIEPWQGEFTQFNYDQNNEGHAGKTADYIADNVVSYATANVPDIVLLHIGTNDIIQGQSVSSTISDIGRIIDNLRSVNANVKIGLAEIIPLQSDTTGQVNQLNAGIANLGASKSTGASPITVIDQNTGFSVSNDEQDGIHPNDSGNQKIAAKFYSYLAGLLS